MIKPGIYPHMSNEEYHGDKDSISRSKLLDLQISPYNYWALHLNPDRPAKKEATPAMILGSAIHTIILEENQFKNRYAIMPTPCLLKDVGRAIYDEYKAECREVEKSKLTILTDKEFQIIYEVRGAIEAHEQAMDLINGATIEQSYFWQDKESGLLVKARPDILHHNMIVDLKTCADASPRAIQNAIITGGYHMQMAMCREGVRILEGRDIPNCILLCIEKTYPYNIGIYILDEIALEAGLEKFNRLKRELKECMDKNEWPGFGAQTISLPKWAL